MQGLEHAIAGTSICVVGPDYDVEDLRAVTSRIDKSGEGFCSGVDKISIGGCGGYQNSEIKIHVSVRTP
ncbi:hypothetical protein V6N12_001286 [Hibiscus sabdariffa]|uniref:Uncharacterized protein n=1 Tax=Hibiscus sabdariffa TaxID=183260 RepID=A0ABR2C8Q2_9ROSI